MESRTRATSTKARGRGENLDHLFQFVCGAALAAEVTSNLPSRWVDFARQLLSSPWVSTPPVFLSRMSSCQRRRPGPRKGDFEGRRRNRFFEIVDLSAALFAENGFNGTNITEISEAADLGRGALYHYIGSKANILSEIQERFMAPMLSGIDAIVELDVNPAAKLRLASQSHLAIQMRMLNHSRVIAREAQHLPVEKQKQFMASQRSYEEGWSALLLEGQATADFTFENLSITRLAILSMHNYTVNWIRPTGSLDPEDISRHYCRIILGGISHVDLSEVEAEVARIIPQLELDL